MQHLCEVRTIIVPIWQMSNWGIVSQFGKILLGSAAGTRNLCLSTLLYFNKEDLNGQHFSSFCFKFPCMSRECLLSSVLVFLQFVGTCSVASLCQLSLPLTSSCFLGSIPVPSSPALNQSPAGWRSDNYFSGTCWSSPWHLDSSSRVPSNCLTGPIFIYYHLSYLMLRNLTSLDQYRLTS